MKHVPARRKDAKKDVWSAISVEKSGKRRERIVQNSVKSGTRIFLACWSECWTP